MLIKVLQNVFAAIVVITGIYFLFTDPEGHLSSPNDLRAVLGILLITVGFLNTVVINATFSILNTTVALISNFLILMIFYSALESYELKDFFIAHLILWTPFIFLIISLIYNMIRIAIKRNK